MRKTHLILAVVSVAAASRSNGQSMPASDKDAPDTATTVSYGAYVDSYYAFDFNRPTNFDRSFTTQPARHNEFNVNLAFVEAKISSPRIRGRLALQAGTSVQSNYAGEPTKGSVSGPSLSRFIQEAVAGLKLGNSVWIDGGIFLSHIGMESFVSRDNLTYTRSLSADFTPFYESGVRVTWQQSPRLNVTGVIVNGWQNISENNSDKAVGARLDFATNPSTTLSYYNFLGKENASSMLRVFNGVGVKATVTPMLTIQANGDYGMQDKVEGGKSRWCSAALSAKLQPTPTVGTSARIERYRDPDQIMIVTGTDAGFSGTTASLGVDVSPLGTSRAIWRTEARGTWAGDAVFPSKGALNLSKHNYLAVTSLALTF